SSGQTAGRSAARRVAEIQPGDWRRCLSDFVAAIVPRQACGKRRRLTAAGGAGDCFCAGAVGVRTFICTNLSLAYRRAFLWQKKAGPGDPQKFTLALVIRVEKLSKRAVTSRVKRGAAPFL